MTLNVGRTVGAIDILGVEEGLMGDNGLEDMIGDCRGFNVGLTVEDLVGFGKGTRTPVGLRDVVTFHIGGEDDDGEVGLGVDFNVTYIVGFRVGCNVLVTFRIGFVVIFVMMPPNLLTCCACTTTTLRSIEAMVRNRMKKNSILLGIRSVFLTFTLSFVDDKDLCIPQF